MMRVDFHIPCHVVPKQSVRGGLKGWYQTDKIKDNAKLLALYMLEHRPRRMLAGPLRALYVVRYPYRAGEPKKNRRCPIPKRTTPDHEQLAKQLGDVLQSCRFFANDARIFDCRTTKLWDARADVHIVIVEVAVVSWDIERLVPE